MGIQVVSCREVLLLLLSCVKKVYRMVSQEHKQGLSTVPLSLSVSSMMSPSSSSSSFSQYSPPFTSVLKSCSVSPPERILTSPSFPFPSPPLPLPPLQHALFLHHMLG